MGPIELPSDDLFQKAGNILNGGLTRVLRGIKTEDRPTLRRQAAMAGVSISTKEQGIRDRLDNRLANDDLLDDLDEGCNRVNAFLTESGDVAHELTGQLETFQKYGGALILHITTHGQPGPTAWVRSFGEAAGLLLEEEDVQQ